MIIYTTAIQEKASKYLQPVSESNLREGKDKNEQIAFNTRAMILLALYTKAFEIDHKRKENTGRRSSLFTFKGINLKKAEIVVEILEIRYKDNIESCPYIFYSVDCGVGPLDMNVCLKNIMEFDSTDFDKKYGDNAAQMAIDSYLKISSRPSISYDLAACASAELDGPALKEALRKKSSLRQESLLLFSTPRDVIREEDSPVDHSAKKDCNFKCVCM